MQDTDTRRIISALNGIAHHMGQINNVLEHQLTSEKCAKCHEVKDQADYQPSWWAKRIGSAVYCRSCINGWNVPEPVPEPEPEIQPVLQCGFEGTHSGCGRWLPEDQFQPSWWATGQRHKGIGTVYCRSCCTPGVSANWSPGKTVYLTNEPVWEGWSQE